jgi:hypothetical protein
VFEQDLANVLKEVIAIAPTIKALFPASEGGYADIIAEFDRDLREEEKKNMVFYPYEQADL